jgi:hypothetical protein
VSWENLSSGLIGGVVGAVIGALATTILYLVDRRRRERNAGRVLRVELLNNYAALRDFREKGIATVALSSEQWLRLAPDLSGLLQKDFRTVAYGYYLTAIAESIRAAYQKGGRTHKQPDEIEKLNLVRQGLKDALSVLARKTGEPLPDESPIRPYPS